MAVSLTDINEIKMMKTAGMTIDDIAYAMDISARTVQRVLNDEVGRKQREIADRQEYFFPDRGSGNYHNGEEMVENTDPTMETVAFYEEMEQFLEKIDKNLEKRDKK